MSLFQHVHICKYFFSLLLNCFLGKNTFVGVHPEGAIALRKAWDHHVFKHAQITKNLWRLKHATDAQLINFMRLAAQY